MAFRCLADVEQYGQDDDSFCCRFVFHSRYSISVYAVVWNWNAPASLRFYVSVVVGTTATIPTKRAAVLVL